MEPRRPGCSAAPCQRDQVSPVGPMGPARALACRHRRRRETGQTGTGSATGEAGRRRPLARRSTRQITWGRKPTTEGKPAPLWRCYRPQAAPTEEKPQLTLYD